VWTEK